jgi:hypothetical protein
MRHDVVVYTQLFCFSAIRIARTAVECDLLFIPTVALLTERECFAPVVAFPRYYIQTERRVAKRRPNQLADVLVTQRFSLHVLSNTFLLYYE